MDDSTFAQFYQTLQNKLPVTFRINPGMPNYQALVHMFSDPAFINNYSSDVGEEGEVIVTLKKHDTGLYSLDVGEDSFAQQNHNKRFKYGLNDTRMECKNYYP